MIGVTGHDGRVRSRGGVRMTAETYTAVTHLNCATMNPVGGRLVTGLRNPLGSPGMVCHCLLVETEQGLLLVDTGIGLADVADADGRLGRRFVRLTRPRLDPEETAARQLLRLGYAVDDVRHIVLTHLDLDHAGGLVDFPKATVHVREPEHVAATAPPTRTERMRYRSVQWEHAPRWELHPAVGDQQWFGIHGATELPDLPGILLVPLSGHTRGHSGVAVRVGSDGGRSRWLLHAGDAYFFHTEIDPARPKVPPGLAYFESSVQFDRAERLASRDRLRTLREVNGGRVEIFSAHDAVEFERARTNAAASDG
jgi:glyoxylase-like metal-dependent hydrolase (beta-lactamase superfamily II)